MSSPAAAWLANRRLLKLARDLQPDMLCLHHCDLINSETVRQIRKDIPIAGRRSTTTPFRSRCPALSCSEAADFGFATTEVKHWRSFHTAPQAFIPNPMDLSIDNLRYLRGCREAN